MIRRFLALFRRRGSPDLIHARAVRVCNRTPEGIAKYRRVHEILRRGPSA